MNTTHNSQQEQGDLAVHPLPSDRGAALLETLKGFDDEFAALLEEDRRDQSSTHSTIPSNPRD